MKTLFILFLLLFIDSIYLNFIGKSLFEKMIYKITNDKAKYNIVGIIGSYLFLWFALEYFIISKKRPAYEALLLGLVIYGVFDMTNIALFKNYNIFIGIIDIIWGGLLFYIVANIYYKH